MSYTKISWQIASENLCDWGFGDDLLERLVMTGTLGAKKANNAKVRTCQDYASTI